MRKFFLATFLWLGLAGVSLELSAQDAIYRQYQANWVTVNPSLTGYHSGTTVQALRRDQWIPIQQRRSQFTNNSFSLSTQLPCYNSSFGVFYNDNTEGEGSLKRSGFGASYAYIMDLTGRNRHFVSDLRLGLSGTYRQSTLDWERLVFYGQLHPIFGIVSGQNLPQTYQYASFINYMDYSVGGTYRYYNKANHVGFRLGVAAHHINKPQQSLLGDDDIRLAWRWATHGSMTFENFSNPRLMVIPAYKLDFQKASTVPGVFQHDPDAFLYRSLSFGVFMAFLPANQYQSRFKNGQGMFVGLWANSRNLYPDDQNTFTVVGMVGFAFKRNAYNYNLAFSYDANVTGLGPAAGGAFEFSLTLNIPRSSSCSRLPWSKSRRGDPAWWCGKYPSPLFF